MQVTSIEQSESIAALAAALSEAQGKFPVIPKEHEANIETRSGGGYSYRYANLVDINNAVSPILAEHGLSIVQPPGYDDINSNHVLTTQLMHKSGEWIRSTAKMTVAQESPQTYGSAVTYFRRYCKSAILDIVTDEDEDGQLAEAAYRDSQSTTRRAPKGSTAKGKVQGRDPAAEGRTGWASTERNRVIAAMAKLDPPVRTPEEQETKAAELLHLDEPVALTKLDENQGAELSRLLGV